MSQDIDVVIVKAEFGVAQATGWPVVSLEFCPCGLYCIDGRFLDRIYCMLTNTHFTALKSKRLNLRQVLDMGDSSEPFEEVELELMVGRLLRIVVEPTEFQGSLHPRIMGFLLYTGDVVVTHYCDNDYVFMMRELMKEDDSDKG